MTKQGWQWGIARFLRSGAHIAIALMWFITLAAYLPDILRLPIIAGPDQPAPQPVTTTSGQAPSGAVMLFAGAGAVLLIALVVYVVKRVYLPATDAAVERMTETAKREVLQTIQKRHPKHHLTKKQQHTYGERTVRLTYVALIVLPVAVLYGLRPIQSAEIAAFANLAVTILGLGAVLSVVGWLSLRKG